VSSRSTAATARAKTRAETTKGPQTIEGGNGEDEGFDEEDGEHRDLTELKIATLSTWLI